MYNIFRCQRNDGRNSAEVFFHGHGEERGKIGIFLRFQVRTNRYLSDVEADLRMADPELQTIGIFAPKTIDGFASRHRDFGKTRFWGKRQKEGCENAEIGVQRAMRKTGAQ